MATTVGHALAGIDCLLIFKTLYPQAKVGIGVATMGLFAFLGNLPDLDIAVSALITDDHLALHGRYSHAPVVLLALGVLTALVMKRHWCLNFWQGILLAVPPLLLHPLVDFLTGPNPGLNRSYGSPLLWPWLDERLRAPITLFAGPQHDTLERFLSWHNVWVVFSEVGIFGGITLYLFLKLRKTTVRQ